MKYLLVDIKDNIAVVTINRPKQLNALNEEVLTEIYDLLKELRDNDDVRVIIFTGSGNKAFIAGADIAHMADLKPHQAKRFAELGLKVTGFMEKMEKVVIAAVNGYALGGGTEFALACDMIYASKNAVFGQPEVKLGIIPGFGGTQRLPRAVGKFIGKEIILTGEMISAQRAKEIGLVSEVFEPEELMPKVMEVAKKIVKNAPIAVAQAKIAINEGYDLALEKGLEMEKLAFANLFYTEDRYEGMKAFIEKRKPEFKGK